MAATMLDTRRNGDVASSARELVSAVRLAFGDQAGSRTDLSRVQQPHWKAS
jgi:hypothetical protein